jgi:hypothetical protein
MPMWGHQPQQPYLQSQPPVATFDHLDVNLQNHPLVQNFGNRS